MGVGSTNVAGTSATTTPTTAAAAAASIAPSYSFCFVVAVRWPPLVFHFLSVTARNTRPRAV